jgi:outer membrane protein TolC
LPIFQGGALRAQRTRAEIELDQLTIERDATSLLIGERIRSQLYRASASFAGIQLAQEAASAALENLGIIRDAYSEGAVDILKLLDAQNQALTAELDAANAVFDHLIDLMAVQRAVGRFDYFRSPQERDSFLRNLDAFFQSAGYSVKKQ